MQLILKHYFYPLNKLFCKWAYPSWQHYSTFPIAGHPSSPPNLFLVIEHKEGTILNLYTAATSWNENEEEIPGELIPLTRIPTIELQYLTHTYLEHPSSKVLELYKLITKPLRIKYLTLVDIYHLLT